MFNKAIVFCFIIPSVLLTEIYDVTTIYHVGTEQDETRNKAEIHLLSNAKGLPVNVSDEFIDRSLEKVRPDTFELNDIQTWTTENCEVGTADNSFFNGDDTLSLDDKFSKIQQLPKMVEIIMNMAHKSRDDDILFKFLIFTKRPNLLKNQDLFYYLSVICIDDAAQRYSRHHYYYDRYTHYSYFYYIKECRYDDSVYNKNSFTPDEHYLTGICSDRHLIGSISSFSKTLVIEFSDKKWTFWKDSTKIDHIGDYTPTGPITPLFYSMSSKYKPSVNILVKEKRVLSVNHNCKLISPYFVPDDDEICLAIVARADESIDLYITVENEDNEEFILGKTSDLSWGKWKLVHFTSALNEKLKEKNIRLVITPSKITTIIEIERISSYSNKDDLVVLKIDHPYTYGLIPHTVFGRNSGELKGVQTFNNGIQINNEFICPPGFSGWKCKKACGQNKFGRECDGSCSANSNKCKGLKLCVLGLGCQCAPGYSGVSCDIECEAGTYGNNCDQFCGNCIGRKSCDIYTGYCEACTPGYNPPYCKEKYSMVTVGPKVTKITFSEATITPILANYTGSGIPTIFQIQYKKLEEEKWNLHETHYIPQNYKDDIQLSHNISTTIKELKNGELYNVRIVLFDNNFNSYDGEDVPFSTFQTDCEVPNEPDLTSVNSSTTSITVFWNLKTKNNIQCPVKYYRVSRKENFKWIHQNVTGTSFKLESLLPGITIKVKVQAYTIKGFAPYSPTKHLKTKDSLSGPVKDLGYSLDTNHVFIYWQSPTLEETNISYHIQYECKRRIGCTLGCGSDAKGIVATYSNNHTLFPLLPLTQYAVSVSAENGPKTTIYFITKMSTPTEIVNVGNMHSVFTNNSITVSWQTVEVCSGFFNQYLYKLYQARDYDKILQEGYTKKTQKTFSGLSPKTDYNVRIFIETTAGWNEKEYLEINVTTAATVPDSVNKLTVYKRGRHLLGLRWEQPNKIYGLLKSFTVSYGYDENIILKSILPKQCVIWPNMFCYTIEGLSANKNYTISVAARNHEITEDGVFKSISEVTKEEIPGIPENVKIINTTSNSFSIAWKYPSLANGIIRSFLMSVEESEQLEIDKCCQIYPLVETIVKEELENYTAEISGLHPASTYTVSLSAKTVSFGPSLTLTVHTRPPPLPIQHLPTINVNSIQNWTWLPQTNLDAVSNSEVFLPLIKANILLVVLNYTSINYDSGIEDELLEVDLKEQIHTNFYLVAELMMTESSFVTIGNRESVQTKWGKLNNQNLNKGNVYKFAVVQISKYCSIYNTDVVFSTEFMAA